MKLNGIPKTKIVQQVSRFGNRSSGSTSPAGPSQGQNSNPHHKHHSHPHPHPAPSSPTIPSTATGVAAGTRSKQRLQNDVNLHMRRPSSGLSAECLQLNAMQINSPPQSPMHSPRRRSSVEGEPSRLSFSSTNPLFIETELVPEKLPQEFFEQSSEPEELLVYKGRKKSGTGGGICNINFTPSIPINLSASLTPTPSLIPPGTTSNSSASSGNSSTSASPTSSRSSSPAPIYHPIRNILPSPPNILTSPTTSTSSTTISTPEQSFSKKILKAKRSSLPVFSDTPLPTSSPSPAPAPPFTLPALPALATLPTVPALPALPTVPVSPTGVAGFAEESVCMMETKEEFAVPRPQMKRKTSQIEPEIPVPAAILNRRRGAISYSEPPAQLKDLVERMNKRPKLS